MPRPFTEAEREQICRKLIEAGKKHWERYGIKRTNVDELAAAAGISKGMFYNLFPSKELFFLEVLQQGHDQIKQRLVDVLTNEQGSARERFVQAIMKLYTEMKENPWLVKLMSGSDDYEYLLRKLPREKIEQHIVADDADTEQLLTMLGIAGVSSEKVSAALRGLFFILLHQDEVGKEHMDEAFRMLLEGLSLKLFAEERL